MAGLVRNSGRSRAMPLFPLPDTSIGFWESMGQGVAGNFYLPGFAGGTAGRCIKINYGLDHHEIFALETIILFFENPAHLLIMSPLSENTLLDLKTLQHRRKNGSSNGPHCC